MNDKFPVLQVSAVAAKPTHAVLHTHHASAVTTLRLYANALIIIILWFSAINS